MRRRGRSHCRRLESIIDGIADGISGCDQLCAVCVTVILIDLKIEAATYFHLVHLFFQLIYYILSVFYCYHFHIRLYYCNISYVHILLTGWVLQQHIEYTVLAIK